MNKNQIVLSFTLLFLFDLFLVEKLFSQEINQNKQPNILSNYQSALSSLDTLLKNDGCFADAVFQTENTFMGGGLSKDNFDNLIAYLGELVKQTSGLHKLPKYKSLDSANFEWNIAIFRTLFDTLKTTKKNNIPGSQVIPYGYSFTDPLASTDWTNMFVYKLLSKRKGNCHSLVFLYKIIADKLSARCWIALAPYHMYIRNYTQQYGWYNTELTSKTFPTDAWIATTSYVSTDAIRSGIYMDTLSNQQSIALCVLDLAKGYEFQTHNYYDGFILKCCDLVLQYHPVNPMALLLKAETLKKVYLKEREEKSPEADSSYTEMEKIYITLAKLHYREMPEKMYKEWLRSMETHKEKYSNKKNPTTTGRKK